MNNVMNKHIIKYSLLVVAIILIVGFTSNAGNFMYAKAEIEMVSPGSMSRLSPTPSPTPRPFFYNEYAYSVLEDGTVKILGYSGKDANVVIPSVIDGKSVTVIGYAAFDYCENMKTVTIPNTVKVIGSNAFAGCISLNNLIIPNSVESIEANAFGGCISLESINIPSSVKNIANAAFNGCNSLMEINVDNGNNQLTSENGVLFNKQKTQLICYPAGKTDSIYEIPSSVKSISAYAFAHCNNIKEVIISDGVTELGIYAFYRCGNLTNVSMPNTLKIISMDAFSWCESLEHINVPNSVDVIESSAFEYCTSLKSISLPDNITKLGTSVFRRCSSLENVILPTGSYVMDGYLFADCSALKSITIPSGITSIRNSVFENCTSLETAYLSDSVTSVEATTFSGCSSLKEIIVDINNKTYTSVDGVLFSKDQTHLVLYPVGITAKSYMIPSDTTSVSDFAFNNCKSLETLNISVNLVSISAVSLKGCNSLTEINVDPDNYWLESADGVLFNGGKTKLIAYPSKKSDSAYFIPYSVLSVETEAFNGQNYLKELVIPENVTEIKNYAFVNCKTLETVYMPGKVNKKIGVNIFGNYNNFIIYGELNSFAERYANENGIEFKEHIFDPSDFPVIPPEGTNTENPAITPTPLPTPTVRPLPTPTPIPWPTETASVVPTRIPITSTYCPQTTEIAVSDEPMKKGDVNGDKKIDANDALLVLKHAAKITTFEDTFMADVNGDEKVDASDALLILQVAAKLVESF